MHEPVLAVLLRRPLLNWPAVFVVAPHEDVRNEVLLCLLRRQCVQ